MMETSTSAFAYNTVPPHPLPTFRSFRCSVSNAAVAASVISILQTPVHRLCEDEGLCCTNKWGKAGQMKKTEFCHDWK